MTYNKNQQEQKQFKQNSYEMEKEQKETVHLDKAPKPHIHGQVVTEDME
ncbi:hypothetical protein M3181_06665 [Mesobacillus maritimus]|nr:hypothetical protein [Mesobacillus maritimus]MCM3668683.1 hypothetical protein [Mesobacillus maritimus]